MCSQVIEVLADLEQWKHWAKGVMEAEIERLQAEIKKRTGKMDEKPDLERLDSEKQAQVLRHAYQNWGRQDHPLSNLLDVIVSILEGLLEPDYMDGFYPNPRQVAYLQTRVKIAEDTVDFWANRLNKQEGENVRLKAEMERLRKDAEMWKRAETLAPCSYIMRVDTGRFVVSLGKTWDSPDHYADTLKEAFEDALENYTCSQEEEE